MKKTLTDKIPILPLKKRTIKKETDWRKVFRVEIKDLSSVRKKIQYQEAEKKAIEKIIQLVRARGGKVYANGAVKIEIKDLLWILKSIK
jgi:hypothetical protein